MQPHLPAPPLRMEPVETRSLALPLKGLSFQKARLASSICPSILFSMISPLRGTPFSGGLISVAPTKDNVKQIPSKKSLYKT